MLDRETATKAYLAGELSEADTEELRQNLNLASWQELQIQKRRIDRKPILDALKAKYPEGTVIRLKGGSPKLTVEWCRDDGLIPVFWFDADLHLCRDGFSPEAVESTP